MKRVIIEIPDDFQDDLEDRFEEFFSRVWADIKSSEADHYENTVCGNYELETASMFKEAFKKALVLPEDVTNGEYLLSVFPNSKYHIVKSLNSVNTMLTKGKNAQILDYTWWKSKCEFFEKGEEIE